MKSTNCGKTIEFYRKQKDKWGEWWRGDFPSWEEAEKECMGYDQQHIVDTVFETIKQIKDTPNCHERDGCIIPGFPNHMIYYLEYLSNKRVMDFGGSLGSHYFAVRRRIPVKKWTVVEQKIFVEKGKSLEDKCLAFAENIEDVEDFDVALFSGSLPYVEQPEKYLQLVIDRGISHIILDRHSVVQNSNEDKITIQIVPECIYPTIYPCWFFGENKVIEYMSDNGYKKIKDFMSLGDTSATGQYVYNSAYKGYVFESLNNSLS